MIKMKPNRNMIKCIDYLEKTLNIPYDKFKIELWDLHRYYSWKRIYDVAIQHTKEIKWVVENESSEEDILFYVFYEIILEWLGMKVIM